MKKFSDLLISSLENNRAIADKETEVIFYNNTKIENEIPSWVETDYGYEPQDLQNIMCVD